MQKALPVALDIRAVVDEIIRRMTLLPEGDKTHDSPHLLNLFDQLAAVIDENTIVKAAGYVDGKNVTLHTSEPASSHIQRQTSRTEGGGSTAQAEQQEETEKGQGDPELSCYEDLGSILASQVSSLRRQFTTSIDLEDEACQGDVLESQTAESVFQDLPEDGAEASLESLGEEGEENSQKHYKGRRIYEVAGSSSQSSAYYILPEINFCSCDYFQHEVLQDRSDFTCAHVLSTWLSRALATGTVVHSRPDTIDCMMQQIVPPENK